MRATLNTTQRCDHACPVADFPNSDLFSLLVCSAFLPSSCAYESQRRAQLHDKDAEAGKTEHMSLRIHSPISAKSLAAMPLSHGFWCALMAGCAPLRLQDGAHIQIGQDGGDGRQVGGGGAPRLLRVALPREAQANKGKWMLVEQITHAHSR